MPYQITYVKANELHQLEWIVPTGWPETAIRECFSQRFPDREILCILPGAIS